MEIPAGWGVNAPGNGDDVLLIGPTYRPVPSIENTTVSPEIAVTVASIPDGMSLGDDLKALQAAAQESLKSAYPGCIVSNEGAANLGSMTGFFIVGSYTPAGASGPIVVRRVYGAHGRSAFRLTETVLKKDCDAVAPVLASAESSFAAAPFNRNAYTSPYGFQLTPPAGWTVHEWSAPNLVSFVEKTSDDSVPGNILVRGRMGLNPVVDEQMVADNKDTWNGKYAAQPGYAPVDHGQGMMLIGGEKAFCTIWTEAAAPPENRVRKWHVIYPRNGVMVEFFVSYPESGHRRYDRLVRDCLQSWVWCPPTGKSMPISDVPDPMLITP